MGKNINVTDTHYFRMVGIFLDDTMIYLVSVIIPCYNAERWIVRTLDSVFQQTYSPIELIVVNDGSTDDSLNILEKYKNQHFSIPFQIISTDNNGVSNALEIGRLQAKGDFVQYLDSDDILDNKHKIANQVSLLLNTGAEVAVCDYEEIHEKGEKAQSHYAKILSDRPEVDFIRSFWRPTAAFLFTKSIVAKAGSWNTQIKFNEVCYYLQVAIQKPQFVHTPEVWVLYHVHQNSLSRKYGLIAYFTDYYNLLVWFLEEWEKRAILDEKLTSELVEAFRDCAKAFVQKRHKDKESKEKFEDCMRQIYTLKSHYIPEKSLIMRILSKLISYRNAEIIAGYFRAMRGV